jgi:hypothetical protein
MTVIEKLNDMVQTHKQVEVNLQQGFTQENSNLSSSSSSSVRELGKSAINKAKRLQQTLSHLPFPHLMGPKCLRLVEVVNNVSMSCRRKKGEKEGSSKNVMLMVENGGDSERSLKEAPTNGPQTSNIEGSATSQRVAPQSGVNFILGEELLEDIDGFENNIREPVAKRLVAEQILAIQTDLGLTFQEDNNTTVNKLMELEDRDREQLARCQGEGGFQ